MKTSKRKRDKDKDDSSSSSKKRRVECYYCGKKGHIRPHCSTKIKDEKNNITRKALPQTEKDKNKGVFEKGHAQVMSVNSNISNASVSSSNSNSSRIVGSSIVGFGPVTPSFKIIDDADADGWFCYLEYERNYLDNASVVQVKGTNTTGCVLVSNSGGTRSEYWILDSGATHHVSNNPRMLKDVVNFDASITTGNNSCPLNISSKGNVLLRPISDPFHSLELQDVLYSPSASVNIISTLALGKDEGIKVIQEGGLIKVVDSNQGDKVIIIGEERKPGGLLYLSSHIPVIQGEIQISEAVRSKEESLRELHNRMGHLNSDAIKLMIREKLVDGVPDSLGSFEGKVECPYCTAAKMTRKPYKMGEEDGDPEDLEIGDEVSSDTFGPINPISRYKHSYIIIFLDRASRLCCAYGMNSLSETREKYILFKTFLKTQLAKKIKRFVCDGFGAYSSSLFRSTLNEDGTLLKMRAPDEPNQNPLAERWIRTLVEIARTLMVHSNSPAFFWEDAVFHANWIKNRVPTRGLKGKIPYTMWWRKKFWLSVLCANSQGKKRGKQV